MRIGIQYEGDPKTGLPDDATYDLMDLFEKDVAKELKDYNGYLNIGRQTADNMREIYYACKEFRTPSKILYRLIGDHATRLKIAYDIYKDKYWLSMEQFRNH